jgi:hypothetical protein
VRVLFHSNHLGIRGTEVALFDYAFFNQALLGNESVVAYDATRAENDPSVIDKFARHFHLHAYRDFSQFDRIVAEARADRAYFIKAGSRDGKLARDVPSLVHAVFGVPPQEVHGSVFAFVSEWLAQFASGGALPFVPHMINLPQRDDDLRETLNIPPDALVIASYGGADCFNVPFAGQAVYDALLRRRDLVFLFMNYPRFFTHERAIFLPGNADPDFKVRFINSCDAMIHAQSLGESFGLACGEFSSRNKPVITFGGGFGKSHMEILGSKALIYYNKVELDRLFLGISKSFIAGKDWDGYSQRFSPTAVMEKFERIFLSSR